MSFGQRRTVHFKILQKRSSITDPPKVFLVENDYLKILADYPKLTQPFHHTSMPKDDGTKIFHRIKVTDYPCSARARKLGPEKLEYTKKEIDDLLEAGIVRRSDSPYSSPMHMVPKSAENGATFRLCGDYRQLNKMTIEDKYPIPNVQTLFHRLAGAKVFSKVDLVKAYHQIPIDHESIPLTAIITPFGLFEYLYMPFGLRNASATFQRYMDKVLQGMKNAIAYVDDIIVFSKDFIVTK